MRVILLLATVFVLSSCTTYRPSGDLADKSQSTSQTIVEKPVTEFPKTLEEDGSVLLENGEATEQVEGSEEGKIVSKELIEIVQEDLGPSPYADVPLDYNCLLYTSPSPRDATLSRMPSSA